MENRPKAKKSVKKWRKTKILLKLIILLLGLGLAGTGILATMIFVTYPKLPSMDELRNYQPKLPLQVYSSDGVLLGQFGQERRIFINIDQTPKLLIDAILSAEDERFYQHGGIDYVGVMRAALTNLSSGHIQSGASTITMQVARNFFLSSQRTFTRKFNEALLAYKIENSLTKDQILELYINQIYLGQRAYGFAEAALTYFGKPLDKLSVAQYAVLAGLPKAPSAFNPVVNKDRSHERELYVLARMHAHKYITDAQYQEAVNEKINVVKGTNKDATDAGGYVAEMVRQMMFDKYGDNIYTNGYKVYTTVDSKMQLAAYSALRNGLLKYDSTHGYNGAEAQLDIGSDTSPNDQITDQIIMSSFDGITDYGDLQAAIVTSSSPNSVTAKLRDGNDVTFGSDQLKWLSKYLTSGGDKQIKRGAVIRVRNVNGAWTITQVPQVEGAFIALDPNNGGIKALVGGFDFTKNNYNHVTQAMRQPGSGFKPFIYSAALDKGFSANTIINDAPICYTNSSGQWCPKNDEKNFLGPITFRQGLAKSINIVTVKILNAITPQYAINYISSRFGFNKNQLQPYLTLALGVNEVTPLQMAQAYSVFANGGYTVQPYLIKTITDDHGTILAKTAPNNVQNQQPNLDPRNAFIMNTILEDVVHYGTGARAYPQLKRNDIAGKTGTTNDAKDVWFNGYTPNLVAITWVGYDQPKSLGSRAYGANIALPIWIDFMSKVLPSIPVKQLPIPNGITVIPNSTWTGNDEYVYTGSTPMELSDDNESEIEDNVPFVNNDSQQGSQDEEDSNAPSKSTTDGINDIINDAQ